MPISTSIFRDKPNLIALSILCQGYLAAHGGEGLGEDWLKLPQDVKEKCHLKRTVTEQPSWWGVINYELLKNEVDLFVKEEHKKRLAELLEMADEPIKITKINDVKGVYEIIKTALS